MLTGCQFIHGNSTIQNSDKYIDLCEVLLNHKDFLDKSEFFDVSYDITKIDDGYRFYVIIDNPKIAMYNIEAIALEKGFDYKNKMAANIGVFEDEGYNIVPNQINVERRYVKGINISGVSQNRNTILYLLVQWNNKDFSTTSREFIKINTQGELDNE